MAGGESPEPPCLGAAGLCRVPQAVVLWSADSWLLSNEAEREGTQPGGTAHPLSSVTAGSLWGCPGTASSGPLLSTTMLSGQRPAEAMPTQQTLAAATFKVRQGETQGPSRFRPEQAGLASPHQPTFLLPLLPSWEAGLPLVLSKSQEFQFT